VSPRAAQLAVPVEAEMTASQCRVAEAWLRILRRRYPEVAWAVVGPGGQSVVAFTSSGKVVWHLPVPDEPNPGADGIASSALAA
jgi:hypothetical protein